MAEGTLPPSERARRENAVPVAALAAGQREGWPVPAALLDRIVAASDWKLSQAELEMRAASTVERVMHDPQAPDFRNAPREAADTYFKMVHGRLFGGFGGPLWSSAEAREESTSSSGNSSKYAALYAGSDWNSPAGQKYMRDYAQKSGMGWAPDDLLRLGPGAIDTLKQAHFRKESFQNLKDAGYQGKEAAEVAVDISRYAIKHKLDANRITDETKGAVKDFSQGDPQQEKEWRDRIKKFMHDPDAPQARQELDTKLEHFEKHGTSKQRERAKSFRDAVKLERQATLEANAEKATAKVEKVNASAREAALADKKEVNDDLLAELNSPAPTSTALSSSAPSSASADKQKTAEKPATPTQPTKVASASAAPKPS